MRSRLVQMLVVSVVSLIAIPVAGATGAVAPPAYWNNVALPGAALTSAGAPLAAISCPTAGTCIMGSTDGSLYLSTTATSTAAQWTQVVGADAQPVVAVDCPSAALCVALRADGTELVSTSPTSSATPWSVTSIGTSAAVVALSCPTVTACYAVDDGGNILSTSSPTSGTWASSALPAGTLPTVIDCTVGLSCIVGTDDGQVLSSTNPADPTPLWTATAIGAGDWISGLSCPTANFCAAGTGQGEVLTSTSPLANSPVWHVQVAAGSPLVEPVVVSCPNSTLCVAIAEDHNGLVSTSPTGGSGSWVSTKIGIWTSPVVALSCPTTAYCAGADGAGNVVFSVAPASNVWNAWQSAPVDWTASVHAVSCLADSSCLASDTGGDVLTTSSATDLANWSTLRLGHVDLPSADCSSRTLCVVGGANGVLHWSSNAFAPSPSWTSVNLGSGAAITSISCPTDQFCAAIDAANQLWTSSTPTGGSSAWTAVSLPDDQALSGVACPVPGHCVVADLAGSVVSSSNASAVASWTSTAVASAGGITAIACGSDSECVAGGSDGATYVSANPFDSGPSWTPGGVVDASVSGVSCPVAGTCTLMADQPLTTVDSGATWSANGAGSVPQLGYAISCASTLTCVIAGEGSLSVSLPAAGSAPAFVQGLPATTNFKLGLPLTLSVTVSNGIPSATTYSWETSTDGTTFTSVAGAKTSSLILSAINAQAIKSVRVTARNSTGSVSSTTSLQAQGFASIIQLTSSPAVLIYGHRTSLTLAIVSSTGAKPKSGKVDVSTGGVPIAGCTGLKVGKNGTAKCAIASTVSSDLSATYTGDGKSFSPADATFGLAVAPVVSKPAGGKVKLGTPFAVSVMVSGVPGTKMKWQVSTDKVNYSNISGARSASYQVPTSTLGTFYYRLLAVSGAASVTSKPAKVEVRTH